MTAITQYINDALQELRLVRWPTRQQAVRLSAVVVLFTFSAAAVFGALDYVFSQVLSFALSFAS